MVLVFFSVCDNISHKFKWVQQCVRKSNWCYIDYVVAINKDLVRKYSFLLRIHCFILI